MRCTIMVPRHRSHSRSRRCRAPTVATRRVARRRRSLAMLRSSHQVFFNTNRSTHMLAMLCTALACIRPLAPVSWRAGCRRRRDARGAAAENKARCACEVFTNQVRSFSQHCVRERILHSLYLCQRVFVSTCVSNDSSARGLPRCRGAAARVLAFTAN